MEGDSLFQQLISAAKEFQNQLHVKHVNNKKSLYGLDKIEIEGGNIQPIIHGLLLMPK